MMQKTIVFLLVFLSLLIYFFFPFFLSNDEALSLVFNRYNIKGASVIVMEEGMIDDRHYFGYADVEAKEVLGEKHHMRAESISKVVAATAVLHLIEHSAINLDDAIYMHIDYRLPNSPYDDSAITIRDILSHQSGITGKSDYTVPDYDIPSRESVLAGDHNLSEAVMVREAKTRFEYSNQAYILLEYLIEDYSDETFERYVDKHIFQPLKMHDTTYDYPNTLITSYNLKGEPLPPHRYPFSAPGGLYTTGEDLLKLFLALSESDMLSEGMQQEMFSFQIEPDDFYALGASGMGLGVFLDYPAVFHGGEGSGSLSQAFFYPDTKDGFIVMTNDKTAWEFLYVSSILLTGILNQPTPEMGRVFFTSVMILYGIIAFMLASIIIKVRAVFVNVKHQSFNSGVPSYKTILKALYPVLFFIIWLILRMVFLRNLIYTISLHMTIVFTVFLVVHVVFILSRNALTQCDEKLDMGS